MYHILKENYFNEYHSTGFVETGISLNNDLAEAIKAHYRPIANGHNDFPKFFVNNEHQAYLEGKILGILFQSLPKLAEKMVKSLYDKTYKKAVYAEQAYIEPVCRHLLTNGFAKFFKTRYLLASYDIYLRNDYQRSAAGIHTDLPNFHHCYETENDLTIYIPLIDLNDENGGRIQVLPESKLKIPGNVLLQLLENHFSNNTEILDENGYIDADKITAKELAVFIKNKPYQELMALYKNIISLAKKHYDTDFETTDESKGKVLLWNNKNFHAAERWKKQDADRETYIIRLFPIYDTKINLKRNLHGKLFNNFLIDTEKAEIQRFEQQVDLNQIPKQYKLAL